jgi:hypothetical protein
MVRGRVPQINQARFVARSGVDRVDRRDPCPIAAAIGFPRPRNDVAQSPDETRECLRRARDAPQESSPIP